MIDPVLWALLVAQVLMGAFDTIWHHELTERLAWRPAQATELKLHGIRNILYAALFLMLGLSEPAGAWIIILFFILSVEMGITLWDFVEEDRTRALPATERVTHTLLTLNYGVILALLVPILWERAALPTALPLVTHGWLSVFFVAGAIGVILCGIRDVAASRRSARLSDAPARDLIAELGATPHIVLITGGTGLVGRRLVAALVAAGHSAIVLTRHPERAKALLPAGVRLITTLDDIASHARIDAIVHLAGESVAGGLWTPSRKAAIIASRVDMAADLHALCARLQRRPAVLVAASAIGYYGDAGEMLVTEASPQGAGFTGDSCAATETAAASFGDLGLRVVMLRIGMVLSREGGLLGNLLFPFEWGLGGPIGSGRQWFSWIHRDDLVRLIAFAIARPTLRGPVNAVAPRPIRQRAFAKALAGALGRPAWLPLPAPLLRLLPGGMGRELFLAGARVMPVRAMAAGFCFRFAAIEPALAQICGSTNRPFANRHNAKGRPVAEPPQIENAAKAAA